MSSQVEGDFKKTPDLFFYTSILYNPLITNMLVTVKKLLLLIRILTIEKSFYIHAITLKCTNENHAKIEFSFACAKN